MSEKYRIAILGIGGVGGYFGGKLAVRFAGSADIEIIFIARGANAGAISENGLRVITNNNEFVARPHLVTDDAGEIGPVDILLVCTKSYDLADSMTKYQACIGDDTVVLPLLNGVNHSETIESILPGTQVWQGCVFIVARLIDNGVVRVESDIRLLQFGSFNGTAEKLGQFARILNEAGINAELSTDIDKTIWEKFIFISALATLTSYLDTNIGGLLSSDKNEQLLFDLITEVSRLAKAKNIDVTENIEEITLSRIRSAPSDSTSSMHSDFMKKGRTELETLTGYVVRETRALGILSPVYQGIYEELQKR